MTNERQLPLFGEAAEGEAAAPPAPEQPVRREADPREAAESEAAPPAPEQPVRREADPREAAEGEAAAPPPPRRALPDAPARAFATDPANNVVLEASAGTGKTTVLVSRYVNLLRAGVDPSNILAITFTRQAAAEMRGRIIRELRRAADGPPAERDRWRKLRDRLGDVAVSTIDAFCLSLLREFPLEADLDPGFGLTDETEAPRLIQQALDRTLAVCGALAADDLAVAMVLARLGPGRVRAALAHLLDRRLVASTALQRFLMAGRPGLTADATCRRAASRLARVFDGVDGGLDRFLADGPAAHPGFRALAHALPGLAAQAESAPETVPPVLDRVRGYFLTAAGRPRRRFSPPFRAEHCRSAAAWQRHRGLAQSLAPRVGEALAAFDLDVNAVLARGVQRMFAIAVSEYERELAARSVLDFSGVLARALDLLRRMDEFAQSRYRLESRYHHVLVDEFQDTSRAQWELVSLLVQSWGEGCGLVDDAPAPPSVFVVGDRKQSIYGFRDAEAAVIDDAAGAIRALRPEGGVRRSISHSFRAVPALLAFVNDLFAAVDKADRPRDGFRYDADDRFPVEPEAARRGPAAEGRPAADPPPAARGPAVDGRHDADPPLGLVLGDSPEACAEQVAGEVARLLDGATVRDRGDGTVRRAVPSDVAILFRSRDTHREFQAALEARGIPACVYKGLGFFDADEIKDCRALLRFLADPASELRAAALLRSRLVGVSDRALAELSGHLAESIRPAGPESPLLSGHPAESIRRSGSESPLLSGHPVESIRPSGSESPLLSGHPAESIRPVGPESLLQRLDPLDRDLLVRLRASALRWLAAADRLPPAELVDRVLADCAYAFELQGPRLVQARENLKKLRGLVRRVQNRGFATLARIADHVDRLSGDVSNAVVDAFDAVNLMTVHAAKGLEFPVVFLVELARGAGGPPPPVRVVADRGDGEPSVSVAPFRSAADLDQRSRELEETKRLLYVAATRARDRLYLSATLADGGGVKPGPGSLAAVVPPALLAALAAGAGPEGRTNWTGPSGRTHVFAVVGPEAAQVSFRPPPAPASAEPDRFEPWRPAGGPPRVAATALAGGEGVGRPERTRGVADEATAPSGLVPTRVVDPVVGRLVHRLLRDDSEAGGLGDDSTARGGPAYVSARDDGEAARIGTDGPVPSRLSAKSDLGNDEAGGPGADGPVSSRLSAGSDSGDGKAGRPDVDGSELRERMAGLMTSEERARADWRGLADEAADIYRRAVRRPDVAALFEGDCLFEVPFTLRRRDPADGGLVFVRGVIDCLYRRPDGRVTVVEVKTGAPRTEHESQLAIYLEAARALFPDRGVDGRLLYLA